MCFSHHLEIKCSLCEWKKVLYSSKQISKFNGNTAQGRKTFEANTRMIIGFREIGKGYQSIKNFSRFMNLHCLTATPFRKLNIEISKAYDKTAKESMKRATNEMKDNYADDNKPIMKHVKIDGAWQRRGHTSLNRFVSAIVSVKCVDYEAMSKFCVGCRL